MTAYRFARVTGPQRRDGSWPGEALEPAPGGDWSYVGAVVVFSGNGLPAVAGVVYPGAGRAWTVVVNPTPPNEFVAEPAPDTCDGNGLLVVETADPTEDA